MTTSLSSSISSPNSVGVRSDTVEVLNVGEETTVGGISTKVSEGYSKSCNIERDSARKTGEEGVSAAGM